MVCWWAVLAKWDSLGSCLRNCILFLVMTNYLEDLGLSLLGQGRITHSRHKFCFPGVCMLGHAVSTSDTAKFITNLPFLLVETTSKGQNFCISIKIYFEAFFLYWGFVFMWENIHLLICLSLCIWFLIFLITERLSAFCMLLSALKQLDVHSHRFFFFFRVRTVE